MKKNKKIINLLIILGVPLFISIDFVYFLFTRTSCISSSCFGIIEFLKQSSLTVFLLSGVVGFRFWQKK